MRIKFIFLLILSCIYFFINSYEIKIEENPKIIMEYISSEDNNSKIEKILKSDVLLNEVKIQRKEFSLLNIKNDFLFYIKEKPFELKHIKNKINILENKKYSFFEEFSIELSQLWENKKKFTQLDPEKIYFSGFLNENNYKIAYLYFYENLITVKENEYLGDKKVLKIFKDGILLINQNNQFEVIM
ncbi:MAG: hypothetical protein ACQESN_05320 [Thermotogota bacterium]